jgi:hypothetical protein
LAAGRDDAAEAGSPGTAHATGHGQIRDSTREKQMVLAEGALEQGARIQHLRKSISLGVISHQNQHFSTSHI